MPEYLYTSTLISEYIAAYLNEKRASVNITKLQKLTYIAYGTYLAVRNRRLFDEHPQAWPYGPVFPASRNKLSKPKVDLNAISILDPKFDKIKKDEDINNLIHSVYNTFGNWLASSLSEWSHSEGTPWEQTVSQPNFKWGDVIQDEYIKDYFTNIIR